MLSSCSAIDCTNRCSRLKKVKLYTFPKNSERRNLWIQALRRKPVRLKWDPDYVPSIFTFKKRDTTTENSKQARSRRLHRRNQISRNASVRKQRNLRRRCAVANEIESQNNEIPRNAETVRKRRNPRRGRAAANELENQVDMAQDEMVVDYDTEVLQDSNQSACLHQPMKLSELTQNYLRHQPARLAATICQQQKTIEELEQQNDLLVNSLHHHQLVIKELKEQNESLVNSLHKQQEINAMIKEELKIASRAHSPSLQMKDDDEQIHFYTGLPSYVAFTTLLGLLSSVMPPYEQCGINPSDQLLMVLMKLRPAMTNQDLGYRFNIDMTRVSKNFHLWIDTMATQLTPLVKWPDRGMIRSTLPDCFKPLYSRTTCIIDCSEIFIQHPSALSARAETYSNYKHHNTVKFLIAISPTGAIIFVSRCWGGRTSDKHITAHSGFLYKLMHGDLILDDRGFNITEPLALRGASLAIPPFTKGKAQLSQKEVETARALSRVRIHVERAIGRLKNFKILQCTLPITLVKARQDNEFATIDNILFVCAALCNMQPPLV
ncbi:uncharacterized protein [Dysidea avara]|uniref:uncharacterized protein isoform X2 n=1 Tax=Dysidea avara TaxID=196820 RepID=UPI00331FF95C